jgi:hypothetical protein
MRVVLWVGLALSSAYALYAVLSAYSMGFVPFRELQGTLVFAVILGVPLGFGAAILKLGVR